MCMIDGADGTWIELSHGYRTARKDHRCYECGRTIARGERHEVHVAVDDYGITTCRTCAHCEAAREWLSLVCGGWLYGGVIEDLYEHTREEPDLCGNWLYRTVAAAERQWKRKDGTLLPVRRLPASTIAHLREMGAESPTARV